jgi:hypothetical protein
MAPLPQVTLRDMTPNSQEYGADCDYLPTRIGGSWMSLSKIFLIIALICFVLEALSGRVKMKFGFGLLGAGLAFWVASQLF